MNVETLDGPLAYMMVGSLDFVESVLFVSCKLPCESCQHCLDVVREQRRVKQLDALQEIERPSRVFT